MKKLEKLEIVWLAAFVLPIALCVIMITGCRNIKSIDCKYDTEGRLLQATYLYDESFDPKWSNKESILKTGNIGLTF